MNLYIIRYLLFSLGVGSLVGATFSTAIPGLQASLFLAWITFWSLAVLVDCFYEGFRTPRRIAKHTMNTGIISVWGVYVFGGPIVLQNWLTIVTVVAAGFYMYSLASAFFYSLVDPDYYPEIRR